jgi:hypothetical protein
MSRDMNSEPCQSPQQGQKVRLSRPLGVSICSLAEPQRWPAR